MNVAALRLTERDGGVEFALKVVPGASRTRIAGMLGEALKLAVAAPPEGGKANAAVAELVAEALGVARSAVTIIAGQSQPQKRVRVAGVSAAQVRAALESSGDAR